MPILLSYEEIRKAKPLNSLPDDGKHSKACQGLVAESEAPASFVVPIAENAYYLPALTLAILRLI